MSNTYNILDTPAGGGGFDMSSFRQHGTDIDAWYPSGLLTVGFASSSNVLNDMLYVAAFVNVRAATIDRIGLEIVSAGSAGASMHLGIYQATSSTNLYPSVLILDSGALLTDTTGVKSANINQLLAANTLYWFAFVGGVNSAPAVRAGNTGNTFAQLGAPASGGFSNDAGLVVAQVYGALPNPFPAGAIRNGANIMTMVRYAA